MKKKYFFYVLIVVLLGFCGVLIFEQLFDTKIIRNGPLLFLIPSVFCIIAAIISDSITHAAIWESLACYGVCAFLVTWIGLPRGTDWLLPILLSFLFVCIVTDWIRGKLNKKTIFPG